MVFRSLPAALDPAGFACNYTQSFANRPVCGHGHRSDIAYGYESVKTDAMRRALVLTDESRRLRTVREAVQTVIRQKINPADLSEEQLEESILISVILALGVGLFGPTLGDLLGKPPERARQIAVKLLEADVSRS